MEIVTQNEVWKSVVDSDAYEVSSLGRIRSLSRVIVRKDGKRLPLAGKVLSPAANSGGYMTAEIDEHSRSIHRLVAESFIGPCPGGMEVNHRDGVKANNVPSNLEYTTHSQNIQHAYANGLKRGYCGESNSCAKLTRAIVDEVRIRYAKGGISQNALGREYGVCQSTIREAIKYLTWK